MAVEKIRRVVLADLHPDPALSDLLPPLAGEEREALYQSIAAEGIREPLVVWSHEDQLLVIDGCGRLAIARNLDLATVPVRESTFTDAAEAATWRVKTQIARRNLDTVGRVELAEQLVEIESTEAKIRQSVAGTTYGRGQSPRKLPQRNGEAKDRHSGEAIVRAASAVGISAETVRRMQRLREHDRDHGSDLIDQIKFGKITVGKAHHRRKSAERKKEREDSIRERAAATSEGDLLLGWRLGDFRSCVAHPSLGLAAHSIRLLLVDPPYGCRWRDGIIVGDDDPEEAIEHLCDALAAAEHLLMDEAWVVIFCSAKREIEKQMRKVVTESGYLTLPFPYAQVWSKERSGYRPNHLPIYCAHEGIIVAAKGDPPRGSGSQIPSILHVPRVSENHIQATENREPHPTEKPVELLLPIIGAMTAPGELVADFFGGAASTLVAAILSGRHAFGCEINEEYHEIGQARINEASAAKEGDDTPTPTAVLPGLIGGVHTHGVGEMMDSMDQLRSKIQEAHLTDEERMARGQVRLINWDWEDPAA